MRIIQDNKPLFFSPFCTQPYIINETFSWTRHRQTVKCFNSLSRDLVDLLHLFIEINTI